MNDDELEIGVYLGIDYAVLVERARTDPVIYHMLKLIKQVVGRNIQLEKQLMRTEKRRIKG